MALGTEGADENGAVPMNNVTGTAIALAILVLVSGCASIPLHERSWIEVKTQHFTLLSSIGEEETIKLGLELELFRSVVDRITNAQTLKSPVPTHIYVFDRKRSFRPYSARGLLGYFRPGMRGNYVTIVKRGNIESRTILYHEYVHFILRNQGAVHYPRWYDEGFAEFILSFEAEDSGNWDAAGCTAEPLHPHGSHAGGGRNRAPAGNPGPSDRPGTPGGAAVRGGSCRKSQAVPCVRRPC